MCVGDLVLSVYMYLSTSCLVEDHTNDINNTSDKTHIDRQKKKTFIPNSYGDNLKSGTVHPLPIRVSLLYTNA